MVLYFNYKITFKIDKTLMLGSEEGQQWRRTNTDPHDAPGEHWVVLYVENSSYGEFFDSFGRPPDAPCRTFLNYNFSNLIFNDRHFQSAISRFCGHYCIFYCLH